ncbi:MAG: hypothetical protein U9R34_03650 [Nanoarchaeota archaeon]|nr:hypothetical protein [Nanoarchaeota archaeon]
MAYIRLKESKALKQGYSTKNINLTKLILESESGKPIRIEYNLINKTRYDKFKFPFTALVLKYSNDIATCKRSITFVKSHTGKKPQEAAKNYLDTHIKNLDNYISRMDRHRRIKD